MEMKNMRNVKPLNQSDFSAEAFYDRLARRHRVKNRDFIDALYPKVSKATLLARLADLVELFRPGSEATADARSDAKNRFWEDLDNGLEFPEYYLIAAFIALQDSADMLRAGAFYEHNVQAGLACDWMGCYLDLHTANRFRLSPEFARLDRLSEDHATDSDSYGVEKSYKSVAEFLIARMWSGLNADIFLPQFCDVSLLPAVVVSPEDAQRLSREWYFRALSSNYELISPLVPAEILSRFDRQHVIDYGILAFGC